MSCGLPMIVSDRVGSVGRTDDVQLGRNGLEYEFGDIVKLQQHIRTLLSEERRATMAAASREIARQRTLQQSADGFVAAVCDAPRP